MQNVIANFNGKSHNVIPAAFVQHPHSGRIHIAGKVGNTPAIVSHSNVGNSAAFSGVFVSQEDYAAAVTEINGSARYHILEEIMAKYEE